ncbi:MAG: hypothetical protein Q9184_002402, partial [Pyrenodesmia sp. 2 TL-2023]
KVKLTHDPNNTAWSRSSNKFGQKLLLSHGWIPGASLGVKDAPYVNNPASLTHVRITAKDDNLGLGARTSGRGDDGPTTGLPGLQDLLGRLNEKDDKQLEKQYRSREYTRRTFYAERRWGFGSFVSGGFLVGDRTLDHDDGPLKAAGPEINVKDSRREAEAQSRVLERKRNKHETAEELKSPRGTTNTAQCVNSDRKFPSERASSINDEQDAEQSGTADTDALEAQRRSEKMERKAIRRARKAAKLAARTLRQEAQIPPVTKPSVHEAEKQGLAAGIGLREAEKVYWRHAVRQRDRMFKRMSMVDSRALNEVRGFRNRYVLLLIFM